MGFRSNRSPSKRGTGPATRHSGAGTGWLAVWGQGSRRSRCLKGGRKPDGRCSARSAPSEIGDEAQDAPTDSPLRRLRNTMCANLTEVRLTYLHQILLAARCEGVERMKMKNAMGRRLRLALTVMVERCC